MFSAKIYKLHGFYTFIKIKMYSYYTFIKIKMLFHYTFIKINPFSIHYNCPIGQIGWAQGAVNNVSSANHFPLPD